MEKSRKGIEAVTAAWLNRRLVARKVAATSEFDQSTAARLCRGYQPSPPFLATTLLVRNLDGRESEVSRTAHQIDMQHFSRENHQPNGISKHGKSVPVTRGTCIDIGQRRPCDLRSRPDWERGEPPRLLDKELSRSSFWNCPQEFKDFSIRSPSLF